MTERTLELMLLSLECPFVNSIKYNSINDVINLIKWLEDCKIRQLDISGRHVLNNDNDIDKYLSNLASYLNEIKCPYKVLYSKDSDTINIKCLYWLISYAISLEYEEQSEIYFNCDDTNDAMDIDNSTSGSSNTIGLEINKLGSLILLKRNDNENDADYLQRISNVIRLCLTSGSIETLKTKIVPGNLQLSDFPVGFDTKDQVLNQIAVVLKMLYLSDFRELQNDLNTLIVLGQEYTANPRTNSAMGKVGR